MHIYVGSDADGAQLKDIVVAHLRENNYDVVDLTETPAADCVDAAVVVGRELLNEPEALGFVFDQYGAGSYMAACKLKGLIACECSDERSAYMTREHNDARLITMGVGIVGPELACHIATAFLESGYAGGRHQIRVDMLCKMA